MGFDKENAANNADQQNALAQAAVVMMSPPIPTQNLYRPVSKSAIDLEAANKKADGAKGKAVAETLVKELLKQEVKLVLFLRNVANLGQEGRTQFRVALKEKQGKLKELLAGHDTDSVEYKMIKAAHATATVRMSEFKVFSDAVDMGFDFSDDETYPMIISAARLFKQGESMDGPINAVGPTRRRGRPATPMVDKFKKFLSENVTADNHEEAREFFNQWMALQNFGKEAPAAE